MNGLSDWFQNNWIDLARLLVQCAIFAVIVRYGRKLLATLRASQEQIGALLKLSVSDSVEQRAAAPVAEPEKEYDRFSAAISEPMKEYARPSMAIPEREPEPEPEPEPVFAGAPSRNGHAGEREQSLGGRVIGAQAPAFSASPAFHSPSFSAPAQRAESPSLTPWVSAPVLTPAAEPLHHEAPPMPQRPSASTWLQAPARSSGGSPWRKMVRWLQAPAGH